MWSSQSIYRYKQEYKRKEHLTPYRNSCYPSGVVMWYKLTNPQKTNIALNIIIIISTRMIFKIFPYYIDFYYNYMEILILVKTLRQLILQKIMQHQSDCRTAYLIHFSTNHQSDVHGIASSQSNGFLSRKIYEAYKH